MAEDDQYFGHNACMLEGRDCRPVKRMSQLVEADTSAAQHEGLLLRLSFS